jgi:phage baseplate assembly protein W
MQDNWIEDEGFLGRGWAFPPAFDLNEGSVSMVAAEDDIKESIRILLTTIPGERVMLPDYGCRIHEHVFDVIGETLFTHLRGQIEHAVLYYEPRIVLEDVTITAQDMNGMLHIHLAYRVIQTNTRNNLVIPYYLKEGTLIAWSEAG